MPGELSDLFLPGDAPTDEDGSSMAGLCEWEKVRLRNIRERKKLYASLQFEVTKSELRPAPPSSRPAASKREYPLPFGA